MNRLLSIGVLCVLSLTVLVAAESEEMPPYQVHWTDENGTGHTIYWIEDNNGNVLQADPASGQVPPIALEDLPEWVKDQIRNIPQEVRDQLPQEIKQDYLDTRDALNSGALLNSNLFSTWCTVYATSPNRSHRTISATGSLYCTNGDQTKLRVTIQRHAWGPWWANIGASSTGWQDARELDEDTEGTCTDGTHTYRTISEGWVEINGQTGYGKDYSSHLRTDCPAEAS